MESVKAQKSREVWDTMSINYHLVVNNGVNYQYGWNPSGTWFIFEPNNRGQIWSGGMESKSNFLHSWQVAVATDNHSLEL